MFLKRIQVPDFRVLKDVDITFEPEFSPRIFPLGSLNGGGKSTLLQLVFILLSCSGDFEKRWYIKNLLEGFEVETGKEPKTLADMEIVYDTQIIYMNFLCYAHENNATNIQFVNEEIPENSIGLEIASLDKQQDIELKINDSKKYIAELENVIENDSRAKVISFAKEDLRKELRFLLELEFEKEQINPILLDLYNKSKVRNLHYICNLKTETSNENKIEKILVCQIGGISFEKVPGFLRKLREKIFLLAPSTQVFLFFDRKIKKMLFRKSGDEINYWHKIKEESKIMANLFTYDYYFVDLIIRLFKSARDKDFKKAVETGEYGNAYKNMVNDLNSLLGNKKINVDTDLSGVNFKIERDGELKELYPEDLSHGELKRLSIYVWLKYKGIEDSIVLIDEIENAFHPDWQYQIISDLAEWGKSNQYILATHSYELCQALTPAHVKELEPKLIKEN